jgi:hypothetical protein
MLYGTRKTLLLVGIAAAMKINASIDTSDRHGDETGSRQQPITVSSTWYKKEREDIGVAKIRRMRNGAQRRQLLAGSLAASWNENNPTPAEPWMAIPVRVLLEGYLKVATRKYGVSGVSMLEYGCGGSTHHFARLVGTYNSIESVPAFHHDVKDTISSFQNVDLVLRERGKEWIPGDSALLQRHPRYQVMKSTMAHYPQEATNHLSGFDSYILQASRFKQQTYDMILIDGHARAAAAFFVLDFMRPGDHSRVAIHDFFATKNYAKNWCMCNLLEHYRVDAIVNMMQPYVSGGSILILQKRVGTKPQFGDLLDRAIYNHANCDSKQGEGWCSN